MSDTSVPAATAAGPLPSYPHLTAPPLPPVAAQPYASDFGPAETVPVPKRHRRRIIAIIGGGVLAVALVFGGGMWAGWAIGQSQQTTTFEPGEFPGGSQGGFGGQSGSGGEQGTVPGTQGDSSDDSDANS